jgi:transcriptional regulator with XRE-family HTH domain
VRLRCSLASFRGNRTVTEMARLAGVPRPYLTEIERGIRLPSDEQIEGIAVAYGVELGQMYEFTPPQYVLVDVDPKDEA